LLSIKYEDFTTYIILVRTTLDEVYIAAQDTKVTVQNLDLEQKQRKVEQWLSPPDPSTNFDKALQQRHKSSGLWFLQSDNFIKWKIQPNSFLWLYGSPGCGKTILSATIIEHLGTILPSKTILYFYFDFSDTPKQTLDKMIRSLIYQFYDEDDKISEPLYNLFSSCKERQRQPTTGELCNVFFEMLNQIEEIWIVLDALDECTTRRGPTISGVLSWIKEILNTEQRNVHLLVTSRPEQDIESYMTEFFQEDDIIAIKSGFISEDIRSYIHIRVREDFSLRRWRSHAEVQDEIELRLIGKADGM
jgi:energy-coupling factor transporter ATP-binding protein EcfA2